MAQDKAQVDKFGRVLDKNTETRLDAFQPWFEQYGQANNVDPALLRAIARQESRGIPGAVSPTGVRGLMQLTQDTAKRFGVKDRTDPAQAIEGAAKYTKLLLDRYQGDLVKAVMAYNSGEGHVDSRLGNLKWVRKEGRDYVKKILGVDVEQGYDPETSKGGEPGSPAVKNMTTIAQTVAPAVNVTGQSSTLSPFEKMFGVETPTMGPLPQPGDETSVGSPLMETKQTTPPAELGTWALEGGKPRVADSSSMTPLERAAQKVLNVTVPTSVAVPQDSVIQEAGQPGTFEVAGAWWRRETVVGSLFGYGVERSDAVEGVNNFNPYEFLKQNEVEFVDLQRFALAGAFDNVSNETQLRDRATRIRKEVADMDLINKGGVGGTVLGMGMSLLDVLTLIPGSQVRKGLTASRALGIGLRDGALLGGAQELALQGLQTQRTASESALNIGVMTGMGGVVRALTRPGKVLASDSPHNPLIDTASKAADEPIGVLRPGDSTTSPSEVVGGKDSVGAARVAEIDSEVARADKGVAGVLTKLLKPVTEMVSKATGPVSRSMMYSLGAARETLQGIFDLGGSLTKGMTKGQPLPASAEDLMLDYMQGLKKEMLDFQDTMRVLNSELGADLPGFARKLGADLETVTGGLVKANPVSSAMMQELVRRKMVSEWTQSTGRLTDDDMAWLRGAVEERGLDFDKVFPMLDKHSNTMMNTMHQQNEVLEKRLIDLGLLKKEKALGRGYGLPQLWNAEWVIENREQARRFFIEVFTEKPDEDWLAQNYSMDAKAFNELPLTDPKRSDILRDWSGDEYNRQLTKATGDLEVAERNMTTALDVMRVNARQAGVAATEAREMTAKAAVARAKALESKATLARLGAYAERVEWATERAAKLKADADFQAARVIEIKAGKLADKDAAKAEAFGTKAADDYLKAEQERVAAAAALDENSRALAEEMKRGLFTQEDLNVVMAEAKAAKDKWREAGYGANIENRVKALEKSQARAQKLAQAADEAEQAAGIAKAVRDSYEPVRAGSKALVREVTKELREARKMFRKVSGSSTVEDYVDDLIFRMTERLDHPTAIAKESVIEGTGRLKERIIKLTPEQRALAEGNGLLNKDLFYLRDRLYRDLAPRIALTERFGSVDPAPLVKKIREGYGERIDAAEQRLAVVDPKSREAKDLKKLIPLLKAEADSAVGDVVGGFRRLLNQPLHNEDTTSALSWGLGKLRQLSFLRFGSGFILNVMPDLSTVLLHGEAKALSPTMGRRVLKLLKDAKIDPKSRELARLVQSMELVFHHSRSARMEALDDLGQSKLGLGATGTTLNKVTGGIDRAMEFMSEKVAAYSGMQSWNSYWKAVSGLVQLGELQQRVLKYGDLSELKKAELASLGIGEHEAKRLKFYFEKYGEDFDGIFDPNANRWHLSGGDAMEMHRTLRMAIRRTTDRTIMTPGVGDTPLLMSSQMGRTVLQLATFGFKTVNTFLRPAMQKTMLYGDQKALASMATAMTLGAAVTAIRGWINGKDVSEYSPKQWAWESLDRSGFFAYLSPYVDASAKLFGPTINSAVGENVFEPTSRYSRNKWWESVAGPWLGTLTTAGGAASSAAQGDLERLREQAFYLTPFNQVYRLGNAVVDAAQE